MLVSATNGKTTTAAMIAAALDRSGRAVVHNRAGSNMSWGVATALLDAGREPGQLGLFEVDEAWLPAVARDLEPRLLLLSNLFRDQLDRYGELELLADRWAQLVGELDGRARFVLNADDPLVADLGRERSGVTYFGVEDDSQALPACSTRPTRSTAATAGTPTSTRRSTSATWAATAARTAAAPARSRRSPPPMWSWRAWAARASRSALPRASSRVRIPLPGLYNVYNAVAAAATVLELGVPLATLGAALEGFGGAFGRVETIPIDGRQLSILLIKNPAGANEVLRTLTLEDGALDLWIALNDNIADGRDISWIWDADFEVLAGRVAAGDLLGHARRGDGTAAEVRGRGRGAARGARSRRLAGQRDQQRGGRERLRAPHLHGPARPARPARGPRACEAVVRVTGSGVIWHDVEHGSYDADLPLWRQLADATGGPILDLGAGTGRVSVDLAAQGHDVVALDSDPELLAELSEREPSVSTVHADAREFSVDASVPAGHRADVARANPRRTPRPGRHASERARAALP